MLKNTLREQDKEKVPETPKPKRTMRKGRKFMRFFRVFGIFDRNQVVRFMPYILFLTLLTLFYIANSYYAERLVRRISSVKNDLKERRAEFISTSSELMFRSKQSEVAREIAPMDLKESVEPQKKVVIVSNRKRK